MLIYGDRVRSARTLRGLGSGGLAAAVGWPSSRQTRVEQSGRLELDDARVSRLTAALRFPALYLATAPASPVTAADLLFRAPVATTKREKTYLAEFARATGEVLDWLDGRHRLPPVRLPALDPGADVVDAARRVRELLGVAADEPIAHLTHRVERAGVPVVVRELAGAGGAALPAPERHQGYSARVGEHGERPLVVLRAQASWERARWTLAHEVGHVVLHGRALPDDAEPRASAFASELLAPAGELARELPRHLTLAGLTEAKLRWGISLAALVRHLRARDLVSQERHDTLTRQLYARVSPATGRTWGALEPGWDAREVERPRLLVTWMERCVGTAAPHAVAAVTGVWPPDLIVAMTRVQRGLHDDQPTGRPPGEATAGDWSAGDTVASLERWRSREA